MPNNTIGKDWTDNPDTLTGTRPHLDPPDSGGDALPSGSSSENVPQERNRFLTKLFQTVLANPVLDASKALKTPQERRAEFEAARRLQNELGLDALEANRRVRAQRDAEYRRTGTEALRRLLEDAYGLDLGSGTPPPVTNNHGTNLRLPGFPDLSEAIEAQMLRDLDTSAIAEQNRRFGKKPIQFVIPRGSWYQQEKTGFIEWIINETSNIPGFKLLGENPTLTTANGGKAYYRRDGSIFFTNETDGYKMLWNDSLYKVHHYPGTTITVTIKEYFAFIMGEGVLVAPAYKNEPTESSPIPYGYKFKDGKFFDPVTNKWRDFIATIHTHPDKEDHAGPSPNDQGFAGKNTPWKWLIVLENSSKLSIKGYITDNHGTRAGGGKHKNFTSEYGYNITNLLKGDKIKIVFQNRIYYLTFSQLLKSLVLD